MGEARQLIMQVVDADVGMPGTLPLLVLVLVVVVVVLLLLLPPLLRLLLPPLRGIPILIICPITFSISGLCLLKRPLLMLLLLQLCSVAGEQTRHHDCPLAALHPAPKTSRGSDRP